MAQYQVSDRLLNALIKQESGGNNSAVSPVGARGVTQVMPKTARDPGYGVKPMQNQTEQEYKRFGREYLGAMLNKYNGNLNLALAAYNAGPGRVDKAGGVPNIPETQNYVKNILNALNPIGSAEAATGENKHNDWVYKNALNPIRSAEAFIGESEPNDWVYKNAQQAQDDDPGDWVYENAQEEAPKVQYHGRDVSDMGAASKFLIGAGNEVLNLGRGFAQTYELGDQQALAKDIEESRQLKHELEKSDAGMLGGLLGSVAPVIATGGYSLPGAIASGAAYGALQPTLKNESRGANLALGGVLGTVGPVVGTMAGGLGHTGILRASDAADRLMARGIQPTIGQGVEQNMLGRALRGIEEGATSIPWVGSAVKGGRDRARNEFSKAVFNEVADTAKIPKALSIGEQGIDQLYSSFNRAYRRQLSGHILPVKPELVNNIGDIINDNSRFLDDQKRQFLNNFVQSNFNAIDSTGGKVSAEALHDVASNLKSKARSLIGSQDAQQAEMGTALNEIADELARYRNKFLPEGTKKAIKDLDTGYAKYKRLERAASSVGAVEGEFTPSQLYSAIKALEKSKDKGQFARGGSLMQGITSDAKKVLSDKTGDSGTAPRMLNSNLLAQALGFAGIAPAKVLMSRGVSKYALGGYRGQRAAESALRKIITPASISSVGE